MDHYRIPLSRSFRSFGGEIAEGGCFGSHNARHSPKSVQKLN